MTSLQPRPPSSDDISPASPPVVGTRSALPPRWDGQLPVPTPSNPALSRSQARTLLTPFSDPRKRAALWAAFHGSSWTAAAVFATVTSKALQNWQDNDPDFHDSFLHALDIGFTTILESELYSRALAGPQDRGSIRALELITKARNPDYRDKVAPGAMSPTLPDAVRAFSPASLGITLAIEAPEIPPDRAESPRTTSEVAELPPE